MNPYSNNPDQLEGNEGEEFARNTLEKIRVDDIKWKILYRNPQNGDYWKKIYPHSEMHGGGPPLFIRISEADAVREFNL